MERFLQRTEYVGDPILISFANLIDNEFFLRKSDVVISDEDLSYRAPLIAALSSKYLEEPGEPQSRVLILIGHRAVLNELKKIYRNEPGNWDVIEALPESEQSEKSTFRARIVVMPTEFFLSIVEDKRFNARDFNAVVIEGAEELSEQPSEIQRRIWGFLLPPWERRTVIFVEHVGIRTKNFAIDFANSPKTIVLKKALASLSALETTFYRVSSDRKFKILLWLIQHNRENGAPALLVFCNLRQTSKDLEARLRLNGVNAHHFSSAAPKDKNAKLLSEFSAFQEGRDQESMRESGETPPRAIVLTVSNDNLEALPKELAKNAINYDIPLDADIYLERVRSVHTKGARMIGLVCERYEVGLSAITSRFGVHFELLEPSEEMMAYSDARESQPLELEPLPSPEEYKPTGHSHPASHNTFKKRLGKSSLNEHRKGKKENDAFLYGMNTEERLAFYRNKYKNILKTPSSNSSVSTPYSSPPPNGVARQFIEKVFHGDKNPKEER